MKWRGYKVDPHIAYVIIAMRSSHNGLSNQHYCLNSHWNYPFRKECTDIGNETYSQATPCLRNETNLIPLPVKEDDTHINTSIPSLFEQCHLYMHSYMTSTLLQPIFSPSRLMIHPFGPEIIHCPASHMYHNICQATWSF